MAQLSSKQLREMMGMQANQSTTANQQMYYQNQAAKTQAYGSAGSVTYYPGAGGGGGSGIGAIGAAPGTIYPGYAGANWTTTSVRVGPFNATEMKELMKKAQPAQLRWEREQDTKSGQYVFYFIAEGPVNQEKKMPSRQERTDYQKGYDDGIRDAGRLPI